MLKVNENRKWFGMMVTVLVCLAVVGTVRADWPQQDKLLASDSAASDYFGISVSISGDYAIVGAWGDDDNGTDSGSAYIFNRSDAANDPNWYEQVKITAVDGAAWDEFGFSVSVSGAYAIVGAPYDGDKGYHSGSAYIFTPNDIDPNNWDEQAKLLASDGAAGDTFGVSVSISGDYAVVGAYADDNYSGSAYIFKRSDAPNDPNWYQQAKLTSSDGVFQDHFGLSVFISGDQTIVGAHGNDDDGTDCGSAYIFTPNDIDPNNWDEQAKLLASDRAAGDVFGCSVSISGEYAVVGAYGDDDNGNLSGSAYIFRRDPNAGSWSQQQKLLASDGAAGDEFGLSVFIGGDYALMGAPFGDGNVVDSGSAYIFKRRGTSWIEVDKLFASDGAANDWFGMYYTGVSISGDYALVGMYGDDDNGTNSGSAYIFKKVCPVSDLTGDCWVDWKDFAVIAGDWLQGS